MTAPDPRTEARRMLDACHLLLADTPEPCTNGHWDCAIRSGGPCSAEALGLVMARGGMPNYSQLDDIMARCAAIIEGTDR